MNNIEKYITDNSVCNKPSIIFSPPNINNLLNITKTLYYNNEIIGYCDLYKCYFNKENEITIKSNNCDCDDEYCVDVDGTETCKCIIYI